MDATRTAVLEKIIVPLDGSELSDRILGHVRRILVCRDSQVTLVRVLPEEVRRDLRGADQLDLAQRHLDRIVDELRTQGANVVGEVLVGEPAARILEAAEERHASLIAMATHGRTGLARWLRGSIAERVLRATATPLLLANPLCAGVRHGARFRRILVPLDLSERSAEILPLVGEMAALYDSEVILTHVIELPVVVDMPAVAYDFGSGEEAKRVLERQAEQLPRGRVFTTTEIGSPMRAILERVEREGVDLVAMTTHGRMGASRLAFGSVAEQIVRHAKCPLLVKRTVATSERR